MVGDKMGRKKRSLTPRDKQWEEIRKLYIYGRRNLETGEQEYPSQVQLAKQFKLPASTIGSKATKDHWLTARQVAKDAVIDESRRRMADGIINSLADLNEQDLIILDGQIGIYIAELLAGKVTVSSSEVQKALTLRRKVYHEKYGVPVTERPIPDIEVNVGVGVQIDFELLSDKEQEMMYNAVARSQIRSERREESDVIDVAPPADVPQLGS